MITTDPISTFNGQLALAKCAALQILQNLLSTLMDFRQEEATQAPNWPGREMRLIATAILRTKPLTAGTPAVPPANPPKRTPQGTEPPGRTQVDTRADAAPAEAPSARPESHAPTHASSPEALKSRPLPPAPKALRARLDPLAARARRDIRNLVRDALLPPSFLVNELPAPHGPAP